MSARLKSSLFVAAYLRRAMAEGAFAALRQRGSEEAGAIFVKIDHLDGTAALYGPAPQSLITEDDGVRRFVRITPPDATPLDAETRLQREFRFDPDLWVIEAEDRQGRHFLDLAEED
ncbi:DUF1491 family protein [Labrys sp. ZIDIC5]|jgi:hypothetical protein|uniref:DUF1491 family protein n=1 Tax=Labrys sedimenti TaxID=3106036 RepID=UPI002ACB00B6|nr:DUF1491 family protein [Labrys sp. ZIDIC5]MDZ5449959.1 DUF1491 family protein [Labrys sp. ZIDIC5]